MNKAPFVLMTVMILLIGSITGTDSAYAFSDPAKRFKHGQGSGHKNVTPDEESEETGTGQGRRNRLGAPSGEHREVGRRPAKAAEIKGLVDQAENMARQTGSSQQLDEAVSLLKKALEMANSNNMPALGARAAVVISRICLWRSDFKTAIKYSERAISYARKSSNCKAEASARRNIAMACVAEGDYSRAHDVMTEALETSERCGSSDLTAYILKDKARVYRFQNKFSLAIESLQRASKINAGVRSEELEGQISQEYGSVYSAMGQYPKAMNYLAQAVRTAEKLNHPMMRQEALVEMAEVFSTRGKYREAAEFAKKALDLAVSTDSRRMQASALLGLGRVYSEWGRYADALDCFTKALELSEKTAMAGQEARILLDMGLLFGSQGLHSRSIDALAQAQALYSKIGNLRGEATAINRLGVVYRNMGQNERALDNFLQAEKINKNLGIQKSVATINLADMYMDMGNLEEASILINEAKYLPLMARLSLLKCDYPDALKHYQALKVTAEQNRNASELFSAYTGIGLASEHMSELTQAEKYFSKAVQHTEDLRDTLGPNERENFFDVKIHGFQRTVPYEGLARVLVKMNRPVEAFRESEYTRARVFAESMTKRVDIPSFDVPSEIRETESALMDEVAALTSNLQKAYELGDRNVIAELEPQVLEAKQKLSEFVNMVRAKYPLFSATRHPQPVDITSTALKPDEWVIAYHVTDTGLITYVTHGKELACCTFKAITRDELNGLVYKFRESIDISDGQDFIRKLKSFDFATGMKLFDILLSDVLPVVPQERHIILIPDDTLGILPFEILPTNSQGRIVTDRLIPYATGADFFGDRNLISYYQSTTALTLSRNYGMQSDVGAKVLVFADPVFQISDARYTQHLTSQPARDSGGSPKIPVEALSGSTEKGMDIPRLALTAKLAEKISLTYAGDTECYTGFDASKRRFLERTTQSDTGFEMIVFATHGYFGKDIPGIKEPVLMLTMVPPGSDGFLTMSEVMSLKVKSNLVALTACQTGLGRKISGEGTMGMGRAFQYAGSKCVLMSLWSVEQRSSVNLMETFFRHLKEGHSLLSALHMSRKEIRKQGYDHPFFWAPFILVGEAS